MAIFAIATPQILVPAYNQIKYIYNSTNVNLLGFKYIFDIYESGTPTQIAEYRVLPTYGTGYGEVDLSKLLQAQVSYDLNLTNTSVYNATNSHYKYDVHVGEEYLTTSLYTGPLVQYTIPPFNNRVRINLVHSFVVGDQINIIQNVGGIAANPGMEGLFTVLVAGVGFIVVNSLFNPLVTNPAIGGSITYADGRKTITRNITLDLNNFVFNGAKPWVEMPAYNFQDYMLNSFNDLFLTSYPGANKNMFMTLSQDMWVNAVANGSTTPPDTMEFTNSNGSVFEKVVTASDHVSGISVGPNNFGVLTLISGSGNLIEPTTTSYEFRYLRNGIPRSLAYNINIDRRVRTLEHSILFLDRMGSWGSFAFTGRAYERGTVTREEFNRDVEGYIDGTNHWTYETYDRGQMATFISTTNTIDLNTDYMTEDMALYFTELISSPYTLYKVSTYENDCEIPDSTEYISCNIITSSFEKFKQRNKNLIKQSIQIKLANNDIVNA